MGRILVTGHLGYIGAVLVPMLVERGHDVVGMDVDLFSGSSFLEKPVEVPAFKKDIRDVDGSEFEGVESVIHLAALSNDPLGNLNPVLTDEINHRSVVRLAALAKKRGVRRFIFSSSCSNYGAAGDHLLDERSPFNPVTPYGFSKAHAEQGLLALAGDGFSPVFLRNATAYGYSPRIRFDLVVNNLAAWAVTAGRVFLKSDGTAWRPLVHVEDIARAFIAVLEAPLPAVHAQAFNVVPAGENYRILDVADMVLRLVPGSEIHFDSGAQRDARNYRVDGAKIFRRVPAFQPEWQVEKGILQLCEVCRSADLQPEDFEGPRYKRLAHLETLVEAGRLDQTFRWTALREERKLVGHALP